MCAWTIKQDYHTNGAIAVREYLGVPVLIAQVGSYPTAINDDGRSTYTEPHILIAVSGGRDINGSFFYNGVVVSAEGHWRGGRRDAFRVLYDVDFTGNRDQATPAPWIALGESKLPEALECLGNLDDLYANAAEVIARADAYLEPLSRDAYEAACGACGVDAIPDADLDSYGVRYGDFTFPEYRPEVIVKMRLARRRMQWLDAESKTQVEVASAVAVVPRKTGQLWEPCEKCGEEPVNMPLHLCDKCWPR